MFYVALLLFLIDITKSFHYFGRSYAYFSLAVLAFLVYYKEQGLRQALGTVIVLYLLSVSPMVVKYFSLSFLPQSVLIYLDYLVVFGPPFLIYLIFFDQSIVDAFRIARFVQIFYTVILIALIVGLNVTQTDLFDQYSTNVDVNAVIETVKVKLVQSVRASATTIKQTTKFAFSIPGTWWEQTNRAFTGNVDPTPTDNWALRASTNRLFAIQQNIDPGDEIVYYTTFEGFRNVVKEDEIIRSFDRLGRGVTATFGCRAFRLFTKEGRRVLTAEGSVIPPSKLMLDMIGTDSRKGKSQHDPVETSVKCFFPAYTIYESTTVETYAQFDFATESRYKVSFMDVEEKNAMYGGLGGAFSIFPQTKKDEVPENIYRERTQMIGDGPVVIALENEGDDLISIYSKDSELHPILLKMTLRNQHNPHGHIAGLSDFSLTLPAGFTLKQCEFGKRSLEGSVHFDRKDGNRYTLKSEDYNKLNFPIAVSLSFLCELHASPAVFGSGSVEGKGVVTASTNYRYEVIDRVQFFEVSDLTDYAKALEINFGDWKPSWTFTGKPYDGECRYPVVGESSLMDDFGKSLGESRTHKGNDIMAKEGQEVVAFVSGKVTNAGCNEYGGNRVGVTTADGNYYFYYAHLNNIAVKKGDEVIAGQKLGIVGTTVGCKSSCNDENALCGVTGRTASHLHFGVYRLNKRKMYPIDPYPILSGRKEIPGIDCSSFNPP